MLQSFMVRILYMLIVIILGSGLTLPVFANDSAPTISEREAMRKAMITNLDSTPAEIHFGIDHSSFANPYYKKEVNDALRKRSGYFDFGTMRSYYQQTSQYDPFADKIKARIYQISYIVAHSKDTHIIKAALNEFNDIIKAHMANINVIVLATALAREDARYGDYGFYQWISQGLMRTVMHSGKGRSFRDAFFVITTDEEDLILRHLKVTVLKSELIAHGSRYYNLHQVKDARNHEVREIFVDVTLPLAKAELMKALKSSEKKPY